MTPLRQKLMDAVLQSGYSIKTYVTYAAAVKQLIKFYHRPPDQISLCELQPFFEYLVKDRKLAPSTCHGYLAGIQFFYENVMGWPSFEAPVIIQTHTLSPHQSQVCSHILTCHTPALGSVAEQHCDQCDYTRPCYHSCRDRHCPSCQRDASKAWCERQCEALLPVTYHHLVFTLPSKLNAWVSLHPKVIYRTLFESVWNTLSHFGNDPKRLNGQIGATMVLHTWGENLSRHVHLHCLVPGGALESDGSWHAASETYLFPVRALSRRFRGRMVSALRIAANQGELHRIKHPGEVDQRLDELMKPDWVVFSKPCPTHTGSVIDYLGRYSHRIAISDQRIISVGNEQVRFQYKDYAGGGERKTMALDAMEFIRRYLLHVLPKGLMRIRHYGLLANRCRCKKLKLVREALNATNDPVKGQEEPCTPTSKSTGTVAVCPKCRKGHLHVFTQSFQSRSTEA